MYYFISILYANMWTLTVTYWQLSLKLCPEMKKARAISQVVAQMLNVLSLSLRRWVQSKGDVCAISSAMKLTTNWWFHNQCGHQSNMRCRVAQGIFKGKCLKIIFLPFAERGYESIWLCFRRYWGEEYDEEPVKSSSIFHIPQCSGSNWGSQIWGTAIWCFMKVLWFAKSPEIDILSTRKLYVSGGKTSIIT